MGAFTTASRRHARTLGLAGDFLATVFFLAGDLAFEAGFAGDFLAALGDLAFAAGLAAFGDLAAGLGLFFGVAFFGAGLLVNVS